MPSIQWVFTYWFIPSKIVNGCHCLLYAMSVLPSTNMNVYCVSWPMLGAGNKLVNETDHLPSFYGLIFQWALKKCDFTSSLSPSLLRGNQISHTYFKTLSLFPPSLRILFLCFIVRYQEVDAWSCQSCFISFNHCRDQCGMNMKSAFWPLHQLRPSH